MTVPVAETSRKTESRFVDIHEAFFNRIGQKAEKLDLSIRCPLTPYVIFR